jgi:iron-sulfur cluster assembly accessory protein
MCIIHLNKIFRFWGIWVLQNFSDLVYNRNMKLTDQAVEKVAELIKDSQITMPDRPLFLRLAVQPGGCSGLRYQTYFDYEVKDGDELVRYKDFDVRIDKMSWPYLDGSSMDFVNTIEKQGFTIDNPSASGGCACGDSFN